VNARSLWALSIRTSKEAEEAVAELLARITGLGPTSWTHADSGRTVVTVYSTRKPAAALQTRLRKGLQTIQRFGLNIGEGSVRIRHMRPRDWAESWKAHFKPIAIGTRLLIKPTWDPRKPVHGQTLVLLDPGLSFGTGQHPTTRFCLEQIAVPGKRPASFLDIGTGSGILAIAAAKLGYTPVHAIDNDPDAVRIARQNARLNKVHRKVAIQHADLLNLRSRSARRYDLVCANLISTLLVSQREKILSRLKPGGTLVLAGILKTEFREVQRAYENAGLKLVASRTRGEWRSGAFSRSC